MAPKKTRKAKRAAVIAAAIAVETGARSLPIVAGGYIGLILMAVTDRMVLDMTQAGLQPNLHASLEWASDALLEVLYWFGYASLAIIAGAGIDSVMKIRRWRSERPLVFALANHMDLVMMEEPAEKDRTL